MKKNIFLFYFFILFFLASCSVSPDNDRDQTSGILNPNLKKVKVFFTKSKDPEELSLVSVPRNIPKEGDSVDSALRELFLGPTKEEMRRGIMTEIPVGTRLIKVEESTDDILVDISGQYLVGGGAASVQLRYLQLYNTLTKAAPDKKFYLHVDGKALKTIAGEGLEITQPLTKINDYTKKFEKTEDLQP